MSMYKKKIILNLYNDRCFHGRNIIAEYDNINIYL